MPLPISRKGRSLELYFIDGRPDGMLTAEVFNWTGHVLVAPRTQIADALRRKEAGHAGVYLLIGEDDQGALAYIGEGEVLADRIRNHDSKKDWWTKVVLITTGANNLNKAHIRYLEARLIEEAREIGRTPLENGNSPGSPILSEAATANMEGFLDFIFLVLPAIAVDMFIQRTRPPRLQGSVLSASSSEAPRPDVIFEMSVPKVGAKATARLVNGEFVVDVGSTTRKEWIGPASHGYRPLFEELVKTGVLVEDAESRRFAQSYAFTSPSAAGAIVAGRSCNGQTAWIVQGTGETYRQWEQGNLQE